MAKKKRKRLHNGRRSSDPSSRGTISAVCAICAGLVALIWLVFGQTLRAEFVNYDDNTYVYENPPVSSGLSIKGIGWAFTHFHSSNWHPATWISHMLDCQFYGLHAGGHHFTNVLLHTLAAVALFLVLREMTGTLWRSAFVAALFAIHPLRVESVAWISERKDVLSGLFFVATLGAYSRYARSPSAARYLLVAVLFSMGLMSKPMLVTMPLVLMLVDYWPLGRFTDARSIRRLIVEKIPLSCLALASCLVTLLAQRSTTASMERLPLSWRVENAVVTYVTYIGQLIWPVRLAPVYPHPDNGLAFWQIALSLILILAITVGALLVRKERPYVFAGWFWYLGMLIPVIGIVQVGVQAHADRYTYLPHIGLYLLTTWAVFDFTAALHSRRLILSGAAVAIVISFAWMARVQSQYWHDSEKLWKHTLAVTEGNDIAHHGLGDIFLGRGELAKAESEFRAALYLRPTSPYAHNNVGLVLTKRGKIDEALEHLKAAVEILPNHPTAHYNLGNVLLQKGETDAAISEFEQELALQPEHVGARSNLAMALLEKGNVDEAISEYEKAIKARPEYADAHYNLGNCYLQKGNIDQAIKEYEQALKFSPGFTQARNNLGIILCQRGDIKNAIAEWEEVIRNEPDNVDALNNLSWVLATAADIRLRDGNKALQFAKHLRELTGKDTPKTLRTVAAAYAENGKFGEAIEIAQQGSELARAQGDRALTDAMGADLILYRTGTTLNDPGTVNPLSPR